MNLLTVENLTKSFSERLLFDKASFYLQEGEKVGILGVNGTGKSTLLKIMAGLEEPDDGTVTKANHVVISYLPQQPVFHPEDTVMECVMRGHGHKENDWNVESQAKAMLTKLGIRDFSQKAQELSGGQRKRLALVSVLLHPADILILDEPTNHLDNEMSDWLEDYLKKWRGALVMVTHDRYFLDSVSNRIVEIDKGKIYSYQTNYSGFLALKAEREEMELASERKRQSILRTELAWIQRGARARSTKQKARIERFEELKNRQAPEGESKVEIGSVSTRLGRTTLELSHIRKAYGDKVLIDDFSYIFLKHDRVGFIGPNGSGKTTLMKILTGEIAPDSGERVVGQTVKIGYYAQEFVAEKTGASSELAYMDPNKRVIDYIKDVAEYVKTEEGSISASQMLERFLFDKEAQYSLIGKLSGGEKRRLNLLRVLMEAPNILILDEPTNDLDIATLTVLEDYLDHFDGIVITVSHDRYFLDRVVRRIFAWEEGGKLCQHEGGYTDYSLSKSLEKEETEENAPERKDNTEKGSGNDGQGKTSYRTGRKKKLKFTYQEEKEYKTIDSDIAALEDKIADLEEKILKAATDYGKLRSLTEEKEEAEAALEEKMERWMYLEDLAARIEAGEEVDA